MKPIRYVLVGDLVRSRSQSDRPALARRIREMVKVLNAGWKDHLLAPPTMTKGIDEISIVAHRPDWLFDLIVETHLRLWPARFRFGLGAGPIDIGARARTRDASRMDGEAFHLAADALKRAHAAKLTLAINIPGAERISVALVESIATAHRSILADWTRSRVAAVAAFRKTGTQIKAARALGITQQAVSKELKLAHYRSVQLLEISTREWLQQLKADPRASR